MKMICEVPDEVIKCIKDGTWCGSSVAEKMIANGIPLSSSEEPCEDAIRRQAVLDVTWEEPSYTDALNVLTEVRDKVKALPPVNPQKPKSEWQQDHEILKAYSDGANAVLDKIRDEIEERKLNSGGEPNRELAFNVCLQIIDNYKAEGSEE